MGVRFGKFWVSKRDEEEYYFNYEHNLYKYVSIKSVHNCCIEAIKPSKCGSFLFLVTVVILFDH